jgi:hypothetical protein
MKDTSAVSCVCSSAQYAYSAHIHIKDTQSQSRYKCRNSEILSSVLIQIKVFWYMTPRRFVNTSRCRCFGRASWLHRKCTRNSQFPEGSWGGELVKITGADGLEGGPTPHYITHIFVFLCSNRYNSVVMCRVDGTCGQWPSCVRHFLLCFLNFPLAGPPLIWDPDQILFHRSLKPLSAVMEILLNFNIQYSYHRTASNYVLLFWCVVKWRWTWSKVREWRIVNR